MRIRKDYKYSEGELNNMIAQLNERKRKMEARRQELDQGLWRLEQQLKTLYAKRTVALNFTLPLESTK